MSMKIVGHRGARGLAPENTIASLQKALEHHVDMIEFDLRVTKDQAVILHHDSVIKDASGQKLRVSEHRYAELKDHKPDLATLEETLTALGPDCPLYVEVKQNEHTPPIIKIISNYYAKGWQKIWLGSKNQKTLLELHVALPDIPKIVIEPWSGIRASSRARQVNTKFISMNQLWLWSGFIKAVARRGYKLYAYPLNNPEKAARWAKNGLYGVVTDYPDRFVKS